MTSVHVHVHANLGKVGERVVDTGEVSGLGVGALLDVQVGDQVGQRVGLDDSNNADVREFYTISSVEHCSMFGSTQATRTLNLSDDLVDVVLVVSLTVVGNAEFSVGSLSGTITIGKVVDDNLEKLLGACALAQSASISEVCPQIWDLCNGIYSSQAVKSRSSVGVLRSKHTKPGECRDVGNAGGLGGESRVGHLLRSGLNLVGVVRAQVDLETSPWVVCAGSDGGAGASCGRGSGTTGVAGYARGARCRRRLAGCRADGRAGQALAVVAVLLSADRSGDTGRGSSWMRKSVRGYYEQEVKTTHTNQYHRTDPILVPGQRRRPGGERRGQRRKRRTSF